MPYELWDHILGFVPLRSDLRRITLALPALGELTERHRLAIQGSEARFQKGAKTWIHQSRRTREEEYAEAQENIASCKTAISPVGHQIESLSLPGEFQRWYFGRYSRNERIVEMSQILHDIFALCPMLKRLDLGNNQLPLVGEVRATLGLLPLLTHLNLSGTSLSGEMLGELGRSVFSLRSFTCMVGIELGPDDEDALLSFTNAQPLLKALEITVEFDRGFALGGGCEKTLLASFASRGHAHLEKLELQFAPDMGFVQAFDQTQFPCLRDCYIAPIADEKPAL